MDLTDGRSMSKVGSRTVGSRRRGFLGSLVLAAVGLAVSGVARAARGMSRGFGWRRLVGVAPGERVVDARVLAQGNLVELASGGPPMAVVDVVTPGRDTDVVGASDVVAWWRAEDGTPQIVELDARCVRVVSPHPASAIPGQGSVDDTISESWRGLAESYGEQLEEVGALLVRAGLVTEEEIGKHGVRFAVEFRLFPDRVMEGEVVGDERRLVEMLRSRRADTSVG